MERAPDVAASDNAGPDISTTSPSFIGTPINHTVATRVGGIGPPPSAYIGDYTVPVPKQSGSALAKVVRLLPANKTRRGRVLHMFSGPHGRIDGLAAYLEKHGWACDEFDSICNDNPEEDLAADHVWDDIRSKLQ